MTAFSPMQRKCCRISAVDSIQGVSSLSSWPIAASRRWAATSIVRWCVFKVFMDALQPFCDRNARLWMAREPTDCVSL